jgi:hypothetical protein
MPEPLRRRQQLRPPDAAPAQQHGRTTLPGEITQDDPAGLRVHRDLDGVLRDRAHWAPGTRPKGLDAVGAFCTFA